MELIPWVREDESTEELRGGARTFSHGAGFFSHDNASTTAPWKNNGSHDKLRL